MSTYSRWGPRMSTRSTVFAVLASMTFVLPVEPSQAMVITLDLSGATFSDGGTASGTMTLTTLSPVPSCLRATISPRRLEVSSLVKPTK